MASLEPFLNRLSLVFKPRVNAFGFMGYPAQDFQHLYIEEAYLLVLLVFS